jgi:LysM repeat protein
MAKRPSFRYSIIFTFIVLFTTDFLPAQNLTRGEYIQKYKDIAIQEMAEFGIPASITLAQGVLESGNGNSRLATEANNHFGIKCHTGWEGPSIKIDDDAKDECFRKYDHAMESYKDHSFFLSQRGRYAFLFDLDITDYKGWARGLKQAGYATNPKYADLLIKIIEENDLHKYDLYGGDYVAINKYPDEIPKEKNREYEAFGVGNNERKIFLNNDRKFIYARKGDDFYKIADDFNIYNYQLWKYNDLTKEDQLKEGQMIYLEKKKNKGETDFHTVKVGETMYSISQDYGIKLKQLYKKNRMKAGSSPRTGQVLWLTNKKPEK